MCSVGIVETKTGNLTGILLRVFPGMERNGSTDEIHLADLDMQKVNSQIFRWDW